MRAVLVLVLVGSVAYAEPATDPDVHASYVSGELRGTTAAFRARYAVRFEGPTYAMSTTTLIVPAGAAVTSVVVHAPDGAHRLTLVDANRARDKFMAINNQPGGKRWAVLVDARSGSIDLSFAAPRDANVTIDVELQMPTCFYRDVRYAEVPVEWKRVLSPHLRTRAGRSIELGPACPSDSVDADELWVAFPSEQLAHRPAGSERVGANAARIDLDEAHIARLEVSVAKSLGEVPRDLATAIVVDASLSMTRGQLEAQRDLVKAYAHAAGDTQVQLVAYARTARALLPSWTTARIALPRLDRELRAIAPRNGSNLDAGLAEAARWLAKTTGTKRVVVVTDERLSRQLQATLGSLAKRLPQGTLVHVVAVDEFSTLERDRGIGRALAEGTGGMAVRVGMSGDPIDATMLVRPIRIDNLAITAHGWKRFSQTLTSTCGNELGEGHGCVWWGEGDAIAGPLVVEGFIWGKRVARIVTPDASRQVELARELMQMSVLDERAFARAQKLSRAASAAWAFYGEWGGAGGYELGSMSIHGSSHRCCGSFRTGSVPGVTIGRVNPGPKLPTVDLSPQFAHVITRCELGDAHVEAELELTESEIVDVHVLAPPAVVTCVEDAIWDTSVSVPPPKLFRTSSRVVLVH